MNRELEHSELSIGANLVIEHIEELEEEDQLTRENLEEEVEENSHLDVNKLDEILDSIDEYHDHISKLKNNR